MDWDELDDDGIKPNGTVVLMAIAIAFAIWLFGFFVGAAATV